MPTHFANLSGACTLPTHEFQTAARIVNDVVRCQATGVIHGNAGTGKTFAVQCALEGLETDPTNLVSVCSLTFPSRPSMRMITDLLVQALTGSAPSRTRSRFYLTAMLVDLLTAQPRLLVVDEAQRLNGDCIELLRHLHDHPDTRFALLYVGGNGCWEVLSCEPMLRSRVFRRLPFTELPRDQVPALMRRFHPVYAGVDDDLLWEFDDSFAHGTLRDWACFTHTAAELCTDSGRERVDAEVMANAYTLLGGGVHA